MSLRRDQKTLLWAVGASVATWVWEPLRWALLPLVYFNTHVHEFGHALAAVLTGGSVSHILVFADGSGVAHIGGGFGLAVASAGYVGSTLAGCAMVVAARDPARAGRALMVAFGLLLASMVLFVRGDGVGLASGVLWLAALWLGARGLKGERAQFAAQFLGVQLAFTSFQSFAALFYVAARLDGHSDAKIAEQMTGIPDVFWAGLWALVALGLVGASMRRAWAGSHPSGGSART